MMKWLSGTVWHCRNCGRQWHTLGPAWWGRRRGWDRCSNRWCHGGIADGRKAA